MSGEKRQGEKDGFQRFELKRYDVTKEGLMMESPTGLFVSYEQHEMAIDTVLAKLVYTRAALRLAQTRSGLPRERFEAAKAAMQGLLAGEPDKGFRRDFGVPEVITGEAVKLADALLERLAQGEGGITHEED